MVHLDKTKLIGVIEKSRSVQPRAVRPLPSRSPATSTSMAAVCSAMIRPSVGKLLRST